MATNSRVYPNEENFASSFPVIMFFKIAEEEPLQAVIGDTDRYIELNLNPTSISYTYDAATSVKPLQDGGVYVESKGWAVRGRVNISGTVGFLPPARTVPGAAPVTSQARRSGFAEINRLKRLVTHFLDTRRDNQYSIFTIGILKDEAFYDVEPGRINIERNKQSPFGYTYTIPFTIVGLADRFTARTELRSVINVAPVRSAISNNVDRLAELRNKANEFAGLLTGETWVKVQGVLANLENVIGVFDDLRTGVTTLVVDLPLGVLRRATTSARGMLETLDIQPEADQVKWELNDFLLELTSTYTYVMKFYKQTFLGRSGSSITQEYAQTGLAHDVFQETTDSTGGVDVRCTDANYDSTLLESLRNAKNSIRVQIGAGDTLHSLARKYMRTAHGADIIAERNNLSFPYIVDTVAKTSGVLTVGDTVLIPILEASNTRCDYKQRLATMVYSDRVVGVVNSQTFSTQTVYTPDSLVGSTVTFDLPDDAVRVVIANSANTITVHRPVTLLAGYTFTGVYVEFSLRNQLTDQERLYGRDLLLGITRDGGNLYVDLVLSPSKDLQLIGGIENLKQACFMLTSVGQDTLKTRPNVGIGISVGRQNNTYQAQIQRLALRQTLFRDSRIQDVRHTSSFVDGVVTQQVYVRPVNATEDINVPTPGSL